MLFKSFQSGIEKVKKVDYEFQLDAIEVVLQTRYPNTPREQRISPEFLLDLGCFFVPDEDYLESIFGPESVNPIYNFYDYDGSCKWVQNLMIPIRDVDDSLVGFTGFNPASKLIKEDNLSLPKEEQLEVPFKYNDSDRRVFNKANFMLVPLGYKKMLEDDYVFVTDGVFDALFIAYLGFNSAANLGTSVSDSTMFTLSLVNKVITLEDNDAAGKCLHRTLRKYLGKVGSIRQGACKDIDQFLSEHDSTKFKAVLRESLVNPRGTISCINRFSR